MLRGLKIPGRLPLHWLALLLAGVLTSGSSCHGVAADGSGTLAVTGTAAGVGLAVFAISGVVYCIVETEVCFPDEDALLAAVEAHKQAQAQFSTGLRLYQEDPLAGLELICRSAQAGYDGAQYFYGSQLLKQGAARRDEGLAWLRQAAAQNHRMAAVALRRQAAPLGMERADPEAPTPDEALLAQLSCETAPAAYFTAAQTSSSAPLKRSTASSISSSSMISGGMKLMRSGAMARR